MGVFRGGVHAAGHRTRRKPARDAANRKGEFTAELSARPWELLRGGGAAALQWVLLLVCIDPEVLYRFLPAVSTVGETSGLG